ncbi:hypothetical protein O5D80_007356 [Batrachochytrium dendrobatidis]|nr:hypothetical protein O5D80_007356 [Batrachochytrium dendrobatidis]
MSTSLYLIVTACIAPVAHYEYFKKSSYKMLATLGFLYLLVIQCAQAQTRVSEETQISMQTPSTELPSTSHQPQVKPKTKKYQVVKVVAPSLVGLNVGSYQKSIKKVWKSHTGSDKKAGTLLSPSSATTSKMANTLIGYTTEEQDEMRRQYMHMVEKLSAELTIEFQSEQTYKGPSFKSLAKFKKYADRFKLKSKKVPEVVDGRPETSPEPLAKSPMARYAQYNLFASAVYCPNVNLDGEWDCGVYCEGYAKDTFVVAVLEDSGSSMFQAGVGVIAINDNNQEIYVIMKGTSHIGNWFSNAQMSMTDISDGIFPKSSARIPSGASVHSGFLNIYLEVSKKLKHILKSLMRSNPTYSIKFIGHSLGAALATIAIADAATTFGPARSRNMHLYSYGSPRVGDAIFVEWISTLNIGSLHRIINVNDPVTQMPGLFLGYKHIKTTSGFDNNFGAIPCTEEETSGESLDCDQVSMMNPDIRSHTTGYFYSSGCKPYRIEIDKNKLPAKHYT